MSVPNFSIIDKNIVDADITDSSETNTVYYGFMKTDCTGENVVGWSILRHKYNSVTKRTTKKWACLTPASRSSKDKIHIFNNCKTLTYKWLGEL